MSAAITLATSLHGRDNNLNLIRIIAASMVLVSHSFVIATGNPQAEPGDALLGRSPGGMAVDIFFVISGFLVTASVMKQPSLWPYLLARGLRIYPGLWVALLLTALVVGGGGLHQPVLAGLLHRSADLEVPGEKRPDDRRW